MNRLAAQQQALLASLFDWPPDVAINNLAAYADSTWARGLKVYQANGHALAQRALQAAYPVLAQLLGSESFAALAQDFWHQQPPQRGDIGQWGEALKAFVRSSAQLAEEPYLTDVTALEWALHRCASAANATQDAASFALLGQHGTDALQLRLAPGCAVLTSDWPVVSIVNAHLQHRPTLAEAGQLLREGVGECALVWRVGLRAQLRQAWPGEACWLGALAQGHSLGAALAAAAQLDVDAWLPMAVQTGLLLGVRLIPLDQAGAPNVNAGDSALV